MVSYTLFISLVYNSCYLCFLLSSFDNKVEHYQIQRDSRDWVSVDGEEYFENLVKLVEVCGMIK